MVKKIFLTFANTNFMNCDRIGKEAKNLNIFDEILQLNETHIPDFINKHNDFINQNCEHGFGNFIWKPKIIHDTIINMKDNDILVYCDAGIYLNKNGTERLNFYFDKLNDKEIIAFSTNDFYKSKHYIKMDAIMSYYPLFNILHQNDNSMYAGLIILRKTANVLNLILDWLTLCENYNFLNGNSSINFNEAEYFRGNDKDNGLYNLCLYKYNIFYRVYPDETNLYHENEQQLIHVTKDITQFNWELLNDKPFHCRRLTPKHFPTVVKK